MARHKFPTKFRDDDFYEALSEDSLRTAGFIAKSCGSTLTTAYTYLERLASQGKASKIPIDDGASFVWLRAKAEE